MKLDNQTVERVNISIDSKKPTYLASILFDSMKKCGQDSEDIHFLGVEIIKESGDVIGYPVL